MISKHAQKVDSSLNATYNVQKADWENFKKNLQSNYASTKFEMQILMMTSNIENMKKMTILLRSTIEKAINENISKRRSCNQSKVWWSKNLTNKRKIMIYEKRQWKSSRVQSNWNLFKRERNDYFYAIRKAKNKSWTEFLNNAKGRKVFQAYKYTKPRSVEKWSSILHNDEIKIHFEEKCNALIEAIVSLSFEDAQNSLNSLNYLLDANILQNSQNSQNRQHRRRWKKVIHREIKNAIFSSSLKKASGPDEISFLILQKSYQIISELFHMIFSELIKNEYHSQCWKESIETILKKSNKNDYSQSKFYRIIMLLNCLRKISEKIIATKLSHFVEHSNLLHNEKMRDRKNRFAIDASLCLLHDMAGKHDPPVRGADYEPVLSRRSI